MECVTSHVLYWADTDYEFVLFHCPSSLLPSPRLGGFGKQSENQATLNYAPPRELIATALFTEDTRWIRRARAKSGMRSSRSPQMRISCLWRISWQEEN